MLRPNHFVTGINYPWVNCNWDFGSRVPWNSDNDQKWRDLEQRLTELREIGLEVIRFWIYGDGLTFPFGAYDASHYARSDLDSAQQLIPISPVPAFDNVTDAQFRTDFVRLLQACQRTGMTLIPSLMSFEWFHPLAPVDGRPDFTHSGRANFVRGARLAEFIDRILKPLLEWSTQFRDQIFAWEVINEPDWIVAPSLRRKPIAPAEIWSSSAHASRRSPRPNSISQPRWALLTLTVHGWTVLI